MDGNKDEAIKCIEIAVKAFDNDNFDKAEKFLLKAEKLYPTQLVKDILVKVRNTQRRQRRQKQNKGKKSQNSTTAKQDHKHQETNTRPSQPEYTTEQLEAVQKVKKCKDYYEILGITKEATDSEIKKSYKRLALQLHPDKNKAPGSSDAFKSVSNAAAVLADPERRKNYDTFECGKINNNGVRHQFAHGQNTFERYFHADISPEDVFNLFFNVAFQNQQHNIFMHNQNNRGYHRVNGANFSSILNLVPLFLVIGVSLMSSLFISDPFYSITPTSMYTVKRETTALKVPYYVKHSFRSDYHGSIGGLEDLVEEEFLNQLKLSCNNELMLKNSLIAKAHAYGDYNMHQRAKQISVPSCEDLKKYLTVQ